MPENYVVRIVNESLPDSLVEEIARFWCEAIIVGHRNGPKRAPNAGHSEVNRDENGGGNVAAE